ncbi:MAG: hypothetical protein ACJ74O_13570 [Frankiaceae bacterium]
MTDQTHARQALPSEPDRRIAAIHLGRQPLAWLLGLPEDVRLVATYGSVDPQGVVVLVESERFEAVPAHTQAPLHPAAWAGEMVMVNDKPYYRLNWDTEACTSCGQSLDSAPCSRNPATGQSGHTSGGGCGSADG